ncbi:MAG: aerobic carbon-monoxide dehydrogenase small subunit [Gaiellales bacterium]|jgi:carbon-monoxide dehydrogenase small subunit|nr:aerobic carbon-monoxide dehydrogenase small subunit [Gaiellales bacterium]
MSATEQHIEIAVTINGQTSHATVPSRMLVSDLLRHEFGLYGTRVGCEHGVCGACTVLVDGVPARACLMLAGQVDGATVTTVEGLAEHPESLTPVQQAFHEEHALQCGFCTPGFLISATDYVERLTEMPTDEEIREAMAGNLCRCTGYQNIVRAVRRAAKQRLEGATP